MSGRTVFTIYAKELRDLLRDRRTVLSMIVMPMLLMPGLTFGTMFLAYRLATKAQAEKPAIMIIGAADSSRLKELITADPKLRIVPPAPDWRQRIADKKLRAAVEIPDGFDALLAQGAPAAVRIYNYQGEMRSGFAVQELQSALSRYREQLVSARLKEHGLPVTIIRPFAVTTQNVAPAERVGGNLIGGMIPYFFLLISFTGAMYPALDLTAGEKERGTMETLLCSPVPRLYIVLGKFLMVLTASLATVVCTLGSSFGTFLIVRSALATGAALPVRTAIAQMLTINPIGVITVVAMVLPMAMLFAAVQFTLALLAKSFKEAQSYVSPLIVVIILPAIFGMLPGVELNARLALVPILNVSLVSKELVSGVWHWNYLALIFGSSCVYAGAALLLAVRMFNREDVIFRA